MRVSVRNIVKICQLTFFFFGFGQVDERYYITICFQLISIVTTVHMNSFIDARRPLLFSLLLL